MARWLAERITDALPATAPGELVAISTAGDGWYPALVPGHPGGRCHGTLVRAALTRGELARLDRYEGREYRRAVLRVRSSAGKTVAAWTYLWRGAAPPGACRVAGGAFLDWLGTTGRAFDTAVRRRPALGGDGTNSGALAAHRH